MSTQTVELLRQGNLNRIWTKYCGFLDLSLDEFMKIQERLLVEQITLISKSDIGKHFLGGKVPNSIEEFRARVPITTYFDYEPLLSREAGTYKDAYVWAHTSGRSGNFKWVPYTEIAYQRLGERVMAGVILASARKKGDIRIEEGDILVYNTPPRPYISGLALRALADQFNFRFIPALDETEGMEFQERIEKGFQMGMETGIDILGSMSVVLVKMGESFAEGARTTRLSTNLLHPKVLFRLIRGFMRSKKEHRMMLPKDIWTLKALPCGGTDTSIYKDKIAYYWGIEPYEQYGCTEEGSVATQAWNKKYMTFFPDAAFYEFIPEEEWYKWRSNISYTPRTVLYNEVKPEKKYELVLTNFYGKPFLRYRTFDLMEFPVLQDSETGIQLPQMSFMGRSDDLIDLAGFTGPIDEKMVWRAIDQSGIEYKEWVIRKETRDNEPFLHLYIELVNQAEKETVCRKVHEALKRLNSFYADYESMIQKPSLEVTVLHPGTFQAYTQKKQAAGTDLAHLKPAHMNPSDDNVKMLLELDESIREYRN